MKKWVCITAYWLPSYPGEMDGGMRCPEKGEIVEVEGEEASYFYLVGYNEIGPDGRRNRFHRAGFRPLLETDGDLKDQLEEIEELIEQEELVLVEQ